MYMSDEEIKRIYNGAANKKSQLNILADLNLCPVKEIEKIVKGNQTQTAKQPQADVVQKTKRKVWDNSVDGDIIKMWNDGVTISEIAERLGMPKGTLQHRLDKLRKNGDITGRNLEKKPVSKLISDDIVPIPTEKAVSIRRNNTADMFALMKTLYNFVLKELPEVFGQPVTIFDVKASETTKQIDVNFCCNGEFFTLNLEGTLNDIQ